MGRVFARRNGMQTLLAVDLGVRTGLALYGGDGRLLRYRSQNFGSAARLRQSPPPRCWTRSATWRGW